MAVAYRSSTSQESTGASPVGNKPSGTASGDVLVAVCVNNNNQNWNTAPGSGWTILGTDTGLPGVAFYKIAGGSEPSTWTFPIQGGSGFLSNSNITVTAYSGADVTTPVAATGMTGGSGSTTVTLPSVTATSSNTFLAQLVALYSTDTITKPGSQTVDYNNTTSGSRAYGANEIVSSGATGTRTYTLGASTASAGAILAINPGTLSQDGSFTETATVSATGRVDTSTSASETVTATLTSSGGTSGPAPENVTATIAVSGIAGDAAPETITATITAAGSVPSGAAQNISAAITAAGGGAASVGRSTTATVAATGAGAGSPTVTGTATLTATGGAAPNVTRMVTATITVDGVIGGIAITPDKRPLVMDRGQVREFQDTDILDLGDSSSLATGIPTVIDTADTYEVPVYEQVMAWFPIKVTGTLIVSGDLQIGASSADQPTEIYLALHGAGLI